MTTGGPRPPPAAPRRLFVLDAIALAASSGPEGVAVRLMGTVAQHIGGGGPPIAGRFVLDDGTASVEVVQKEEVEEVEDEDEEEEGEGGGAAGPTTRPLRRRRPLPPPGTLVDCVGRVRLPDDAPGPASSGGGGALGEVPPPLPLLEAASVAPAAQRGAEALRTLEILLQERSRPAAGLPGRKRRREGEDGREEAGGAPPDGDGYGDGTGFHLAGDLMSSGIGVFRPSQEGEGGTSPRVGAAAAFRLLRSAASDGGLTEEDLALVLGYGGRDGGRVREVLQELQMGGEIYKTRRGTYLPL